MRKKQLLILVLIPFVFASCRKNESNVFLDNVELLVKEFERSFVLEGHEVLVPVLGISDICIYDTLIVFSSSKDDKFYSFFSVDDLAFYGSYITRGNGPNEFVSMRRPLFFEKKEDEILIAFYETTKSQLLFFNLTESQRSQSAVFSEKRVSFNGLMGIYGCYPLNSNEYFIDYIDIDKVTQHYSVFDLSLNQLVSDNLAIDMDLEELDNSFLLATATAFNSHQMKYASGMKFMDQINIYNIESPHLSFSISTSQKRDNPSEVECKAMPEKMEYYFDLRSTDSYIFGLYANQNRKDWAMENMPATIHVFDWEGNALVELKTQEKIVSFDVDSKNKKLYGLTIDEQLYIYDLPDLRGLL